MKATKMDTIIKEGSKRIEIIFRGLLVFAEASEIFPYFCAWGKFNKISH